MANNLFVGPNAATAKIAIGFTAAGFTAANCLIIYKVGSPSQSWIPGRSFNPITGFTVGTHGYYIIMKVAGDYTAYLAPPLTGVTPPPPSSTGVFSTAFSTQFS